MKFINCNKQFFQLHEIVLYLLQILISKFQYLYETTENIIIQLGVDHRKDWLFLHFINSTQFKMNFKFLAAFLLVLFTYVAAGEYRFYCIWKSHRFPIYSMKIFILHRGEIPTV